MAPNQSPIRVMVVGDSISHGREGDWTWRYRIWEWFRREGIPVSFVGPYKGTVHPDDPEPPRPPPLISEPARPDYLRTDGGYARGVSPDFLANSDHFAAGGRQAAQAMQLVAEQVAAYQPDYCLVQLGFNDIAWGKYAPALVLASIRFLVDQARSAKPDVKFAIADVPQRTFIPGREDLPRHTDAYNELLAHYLPQWSTEGSPVALVRLCENYSCGPDTSEAAYDGLHPNALGEYQIAQAFSRTLVGAFSIGLHELRVPIDIPARPMPTPTNFQAISSPSGIVVTWDAVYGAFGYDICVRMAGSSSPDEWFTTYHVNSNRHDTTRCVAGERWEYQLRSSGGSIVHSPWSAVVSAIAHPQTAPGPSSIVTHPTAAGFSVIWDPPTGDFGDIDRYGVYWLDTDTPGALPGVVGVRNTAAEVVGLTEGHKYIIALDTWTAAGGGLLADARPVRVGMGKPPTPSGVRAVALDATTVELSWEVDPSTTGSVVWVADAADHDTCDKGCAGQHETDSLTRAKRTEPYHGIICDNAAPTVSNEETTPTLRSVVLGGLVPSVCEFVFAVGAYNGNDESDLSEWIMADICTRLHENVHIDEGDSVHIQIEGINAIRWPAHA
ncbi:carbohydrate esterase family 3 protein [Podospora appendiculata]|uniref:Carbohydrate esterase family 3 protein n=1 Tax=Podospora appendiculata TaxID=314037 RepID=A0AAE0XAB2_9PEZI|nr:carbohydrate esterase family 3 protein [Podospora appendiculata]